MSIKLSRERLRESFENVLEHVWEQWHELGLKGTPWGTADELIEETSLTSQEVIDFYTDVGWVRGVSQSTGWSLDRPQGPREWSPRKSK